MHSAGLRYPPTLWGPPEGRSFALSHSGGAAQRSFLGLGTACRGAERIRSDVEAPPVNER